MYNQGRGKEALWKWSQVKVMAKRQHTGAEGGGMPIVLTLRDGTSTGNLLEDQYQTRDIKSQLIESQSHNDRIGMPC